MIQQAALFHRAGELPAAERLYRSVLEIDPSNFPALYYLGLVCAQRGQTDVAIQLFRKAIAIDPNLAEVHNNLGMALFAKRCFAEAVTCYEMAISLNPSYPLAYNNLGTVRGALGHHIEAIREFEKALAIRGDYVEALNNIGTEYFALNRYDEAIAYFDRAVAVRPDFADAQLNLGNALLMKERPEEALACYRRELELRPRSVDAMLRTADLLQRLRRHGEAICLYKKAAEERPQSAEIHLKLANYLQTLCRHEEALAVYHRILSADPRQAEAYDCIGFALAEMGNIAGARKAFENALRVEPKRIKSLYGMVNLGNSDDGAQTLDALTRLALDMSVLSVADQIMLHFALGKALADSGQHRQSFEHLLAGNALRRLETVYDEDRTLGRFSRARDLFTRDLVRSDRGGLISRRPIFILGMMRSGSTLVEQMLANHTNVFAAGERLDLAEALHTALGAEANLFPTPDIASTLTTDVLRRIGADYLARLDTAECDARALHSNNPPRVVPAGRIIDKLPGNFLFVGLIHLIFPNASIIHTCRDPVDTCLSCFSNLFVSNQPHTYDLGELGRYYRSYSKLMAHWREVLPPDRMLEVQYEDIVDDFETQARRIVDYCGLDWQDSCLEFFRGTRPVRTASMAQVRRPIYRSSVGRPRPNEATLRPLLDALFT